MLGWLSLVGFALAAPPDHAPTGAVFGAASAGSAITRLVVSKDKLLVAGVSDSGGLVSARRGQVVLVDASTWTVGETSFGADECYALSVAVASRTAGGDWVWIGCQDGTIETWVWQDGSLTAYKGGGSTPLVFDLAAVSAGGAARSVIGLWPSPSGDALYALDDGAEQLDTYAHKLFVTDGELTEDGTYTASGLFGDADPIDAVLRPGTVTDDPGQVIVAHGGSNFAIWTLSSGFVQRSQLALLALDPTDLAPHELSGAYVAERSNDRISRWDGTTSPNSVVVLRATGLNAPRGIVGVTDASTGVVSHLVADGDGDGNHRMQVFADVTAEPTSQFDLDFVTADLVAGLDGYVFAGTEGGTIRVLTRGPWVDKVTLSETSAVAGDTIDLTFKSDTEGSYKVVQDGTYSGGGTTLSTGDITADAEGAATFTVDSTWTEGDHSVWVRVTDGGGDVGYARAVLTIDNPPSGVQLRNANVGFVDRGLVLSFDALTASDTTGYDVYISRDPFTDADYPDGGGPTGVVDGVTSPISVDQPTDSSTVTVKISKLVNDTTYYVAVRGKDSKRSGPMSNVVSETPRDTLSASDVTGEPGGPPAWCATGPTGLLGGIGALGAVALLRRRRGALAALVVAALTSTSAARAQDSDDDDGPPSSRPRGLSRFDRDVTSAWGNFTFDGGSYAYKDATIQGIYGQRGVDFRVSAGVQLFRYAEFNVGVGLVTKKGNTVDSTGQSSAEYIRLQMAPFSLDGRLRVHVIDEQPVVPFGGVGVDWVFWRETPLDADKVPVAAGRVVGSKLGWHWDAGVNILLDTFAPNRASELEARSGINDTWLTIQYRKQIVGKAGDAGLDLDGWTLSGGLKIDF
jgi:hypothetical protein